MAARPKLGARLVRWAFTIGPPITDAEIAKRMTQSMAWRDKIDDETQP